MPCHPLPLLITRDRITGIPVSNSHSVSSVANLSSLEMHCAKARSIVVFPADSGPTINSDRFHTTAAGRNAIIEREIVPHRTRCSRWTFTNRGRRIVTTGCGVTSNINPSRASYQT
jgi:hypothetical protein